MRRRASCLIHRLVLTTSSVCGKPVSRGQIHATILIYNMHVKLVHIALPIEVVHDDDDCASPIRRRMMACISLEEASSSLLIKLFRNILWRSLRFAPLPRVVELLHNAA